MYCSSKECSIDAIMTGGTNIDQPRPWWDRYSSLPLGHEATTRWQHDLRGDNPFWVGKKLNYKREYLRQLNNLVKARQINMTMTWKRNILKRSIVGTNCRIHMEADLV